jgi:hypothetical protein
MVSAAISNKGKIPRMPCPGNFGKKPWRQFLFITGTGYELYCFTAKATRQNVMNVHSATDEIIGWYPVESLPQNILPNLKWIVPMANYKFEITGTIIHESEEC